MSIFLVDAITISIALNSFGVDKNIHWCTSVIGNVIFIRNYVVDVFVEKY